MGWLITFDQCNLKATLSKDGVAIVDLFPHGTAVTEVTLEGHVYRHTNGKVEGPEVVESFIALLYSLGTAINDLDLGPGLFDVRAYNVERIVARRVTPNLFDAMNETNKFMAERGIVKVDVYDTAKKKIIHSQTQGPAGD